MWTELSTAIVLALLQQYKELQRAAEAVETRQGQAQQGSVKCTRM